MAAPIPPIGKPVVGPDGICTVEWHRFFTDLRVRLGGDADLTLSAGDTAFTATVIGSDGIERDGGLVLS